MADYLKARDQKIDVLQPKMNYCEKVLESTQYLTSELIPKEYGESATWLYEKMWRSIKCIGAGGMINVRISMPNWAIVIRILETRRERDLARIISDGLFYDNWFSITHSRIDVTNWRRESASTLNISASIYSTT